MATPETRLGQRQNTFKIDLIGCDIRELFLIRPRGNFKYIDLEDNWGEITASNEAIGSIALGFDTNEDARSPEDHPYKWIQFVATFNFAEKYNISHDVYGQKILSEFATLGIPLTFGRYIDELEGEREGCLGASELTPFILFWDTESGVTLSFPKDKVRISEEEFHLLFKKYLDIVEKTIRAIYNIEGVDIPTRTLRITPFRYGYAHAPVQLVTPQSGTHEQKKLLRQCTSCSSQYYIDESPECPHCGDSRPKPLNSSGKK